MTETTFTPAPKLAADPKAARKDLDGLKAAYLQHLQLRNMTALTVRQMEQVIRFFIAFMRGREVDDIGQVDQDLLERYKTHLTNYQTRKGAHLHVNTIYDRIKVIKRWFLWMRKKGVIFYDPAAAVEPPHLSKPLPRGVMSVAEIQKVFKVPSLKNPIGYRDRTIMEVLYATGIRCGELVSLEIEGRGLAAPGSQGPLRQRRERAQRAAFDAVLPLPAALHGRDSGPNWPNACGPAATTGKQIKDGGDTLFLSIYGGRFSRNWIGDMMRRYIREAGVTSEREPRPWLPALGRHALARKRNGHPLCPGFPRA